MGGVFALWRPKLLDVLTRRLSALYGKPYPPAEAKRTGNTILAGRSVGDPVAYVLAAVLKDYQRWAPSITWTSCDERWHETYPVGGKCRQCSADLLAKQDDDVIG